MLQDRIDSYRQLEETRGSRLLVYYTSDRRNMETQIAHDILPFFTEHLDLIEGSDKISLFLYTRGGNTLAAWSLVNLIRNFCDDFEIIIPFTCHSAGTLMCLGANRILMTKQATLGPIDPSVNGPLNPQMPGTNDPKAKVPVSVEFVKAYLDMAKTELGIKDQEALSNILINLSNKIHPLTLGQVYRSKSQIQMLAKKLLINHELKSGKEKELIKFLASESGSHDYTIHRKEAKENLGLNVEKPNADLYRIIKSIHDDIDKELELTKPYDPKIILGQQQSYNYTARRGIIESLARGTDVYVSKGTLQKQQQQTPQGQKMTKINDSRSYEGWIHENIQ